MMPPRSGEEEQGEEEEEELHLQGGVRGEGANALWALLWILWKRHFGCYTRYKENSISDTAL